MPNYSCTFQRSVLSTTLGVGGIDTGGTPERFQIYDIVLGSEDVPSDNAVLWRLMRYTGGTGTRAAITPQPLDTADIAASQTTLTAGQNFSINPTTTSTLLNVPLNQRMTFRWLAVPGGELFCPATASNGLILVTPSFTSSFLATATCHIIWM